MDVGVYLWPTLNGTKHILFLQLDFAYVLVQEQRTQQDINIISNVVPSVALF